MFDRIKAAPDELRNDHQLVLAGGDYVMLTGRFSNIGAPANCVVVDVVRIDDGVASKALERDPRRGHRERIHKRPTRFR
ncbi:hypothetical protein [Mycobacterium sp.]|uniref:hypothetical protein n=1 Tax=Mycobacterium sp. TaxID=1785 RepID=UPI003D0B2DD6